MSAALKSPPRDSLLTLGLMRVDFFYVFISNLVVNLTFKYEGKYVILYDN
jgi:hypothetical protein